MRHAQVRIIVLGTLLALGPWSGVARAGDDVETARQLAREGLALFEQHDWSTAYATFAEANRLHRAPTLLLYMARCERHQGRLLEARSLYQAVIRAPLTPAASQPFTDAQASARTELGEVNGRIPSVTIAVRAPSAATAEVHVDGKLLTAAERQRPVPLNPGLHLITAAAPGLSPAARTVELADRAAITTVELELVPVRAAASETREPAPSEGSAGPMWAAGIAFGVAGAGLVLGTITGAVALSKTEDIKSRCQGTQCRLADQDEAQSARALATVSTVAFVVAGAGVVAGSIALIGGALDQPSTSSEATLRLELGPGHVGLAGGF